MEQLKTFLDLTSSQNDDFFLIKELRNLYGGDLIFPDFPRDCPYVIMNSVTTIEGLTSFNMPGHMGGGDISGFNPQDAFVMGLLRSVSDGVAVGANTLRMEPRHLWTPSFISPEHWVLYREQRHRMTMTRKNPYTIFVTGSGHVLEESGLIPLSFTSPDIETIILTTKSGKKVVRREFEQHGHPAPHILAVDDGKQVDLLKAFHILKKDFGIRRLLVEGGARFNGSVIDTGLHHEVFKTIAPIIIGTTPEAKRPLFVSGFTRTPKSAIKHELISSKYCDSHLFNRYRKIFYQ